MAANHEQRSKAEVESDKAQEALRRRVDGLLRGIDSLKKEIATNSTLGTLPPPLALQSRINGLKEQIAALMQDWERHSSSIGQTVFMPNLQFPARYHQNILDVLMRTKLEPGLEDWVEQSLKTAHEKEKKEERERKGGNTTVLSESDRKELWQWAPMIANQEARKHVWETADYTMAEKEAGIENVRTGLRRELVIPELPDEDEDEDDEYAGGVEEDDEADDDKMDVDITRPKQGVTVQPTQPAQPPMHIDDVLRFMTRGG